jgi:hypothetical protein
MCPACMATARWLVAGTLLPAAMATAVVHFPRSSRAFAPCSGKEMGVPGRLNEPASHPRQRRNKSNA